MFWWCLEGYCTSNTCLQCSYTLKHYGLEWTVFIHSHKGYTYGILFTNSRGRDQFIWWEEEIKSSLLFFQCLISKLLALLLQQLKIRLLHHPCAELERAIVHTPTCTQNSSFSWDATACFHAYRVHSWLENYRWNHRVLCGKKNPCIISVEKKWSKIALPSFIINIKEATALKKFWPFPI